MSILFEETAIGRLKLKNRFVRSATWAGMAGEDGGPTPKLVQLMSDLACGGVGLIVTGHAYVHPLGKHSPWQLGIDRDGLIPGLKEMVSVVQAEDAKIAVQLGYGGAYLSQSRIAGLNPKGIQTIVNAYAGAARRAKLAGFDALQILAAHGFLLSQFLCPRYNPRGDDYGGRLDNRARLLMEVLEAVRNEVGPDFPILVKLNAFDGVERGMTLDESVQVGTMLQQGGIDAIELSGGLLNVANLLDERVGEGENVVYFEKAAAVFKKKIEVPIVLVGGIRSFEKAESLVDSGTADYIAMCRPLIREPALVNRWHSGDTRRAECLSCNNCVEQVKKGAGISCKPPGEKPVVQTFFPQNTSRVPASPPFPPGTCYAISTGLEKWGSTYLPVVKIQMVVNDKLIDSSPSMPAGSGDHEKIMSAIETLLAEAAE